MPGKKKKVRWVIDMTEDINGYWDRRLRWRTLNGWMRRSGDGILPLDEDLTKAKEPWNE